MQGAILGMSGGNDLDQRIKSLKEKRKNDRVNLVLYAAAKGDLQALKTALKARTPVSIFINFILACCPRLNS